MDELTQFRQYYLQTHPNATKSQIAQLDDFISQRQQEQAIQAFSEAGVNPTDIPTDPIQQAVALQQVKTGKFMGKKQQDKQVVQDKATEAAKGILQTIQNKKNLSKEQYNMDISNYASQLAAAKGFAEGGKVLSNAELSILAGQIPIFKKRVPTFWEEWKSKFTGTLPNVTDEVQDSETQLRNKASKIIEQFGGAKIPDQITEISQKKPTTSRYKIISVE